MNFLNCLVNIKLYTHYIGDKAATF
jgi:hypothetical protein